MKSNREQLSESSKFVGKSMNNSQQLSSQIHCCQTRRKHKPAFCWFLIYNTTQHEIYWVHGGPLAPVLYGFTMVYRSLRNFGPPQDSQHCQHVMLPRIIGRFGRPISITLSQWHRQLIHQPIFLAPTGGMIAKPTVAPSMCVPCPCWLNPHDIYIYICIHTYNIHTIYT